MLEEIKKSIKTLEYLKNHTELLCELSEDERIELFTHCGQLTRPDKKEIRKRQKEVKIWRQKKKVQEIKEIRGQTGIRSARTSLIFEAPKEIKLLSAEHYKETPELPKPQNCYVCKKMFTKLHFFYDALCDECGDFNYHKRFQNADLKGQVILVTGSRVKIGYQAVLKLLRSNAIVIATTRFPVDSAKRFSKEEDYPFFKDRLHIYGLDLRHTPSVELFCHFIEQKYKRLDIIINNAAQTVRRPPQFYQHLLVDEKKPMAELSPEVQLLVGHHRELISMIGHNDDQETKNTQQQIMPSTFTDPKRGMGISKSAELSLIAYTFEGEEAREEFFPDNKFDADLQQVDLRTTNSWRLKLGEISSAEMLEVQLINAVAPFVLCNRLIPLMKREQTGTKHIVNVTAMEGKFYRFKKEDRHPHTNMAKAALNMLTHTAAGDLEKFGIYINAVDTGWVTDEDPAGISKEKQEKHNFQPPIDIVDGAARICDPFIDGILTGKHWSGQFLKDYRPIDW